MHQDQPCVLILEDDKFSSKLVYSAISQQLDDVCLFPAYDIDQARILAQHLDFDLVIADITLPDGNGVDFVFDLMMVKPILEVILMSASQPADVSKRTADMSTVHFIPKPLEVEPLLELVEPAIAKAVPTEPNSSLFKARITQIKPMDLVQMKCLSNASEVLEFVPKSGTVGLLYFRNGQIVHAETEDIIGEDAFHKILSWKGGEVNELPLPMKIDETITKDWQGLLMNAAHQLDSDSQKLTVPSENKDRNEETSEESTTVNLPQATEDLQALLITNSKGGVRSSFGLKDDDAHAFAAHLAAMRPDVQQILNGLGLGELNKLEFSNRDRGAMAQLDANGSVLALGSARALHERSLTKNAIRMMDQLLRDKA